MSDENSQAADSKPRLVGKAPRRFPKRVSAGDLSERVQLRIVELMLFHECSDRAAEHAQREFPSFRITGKTVSDVMILRTARKPPTMAPTLHFAAAAGMQRRSA